MKKYWERNNKRRPLPGIIEAAKKYGEGVYFPAPVYVPKGQCRFCGACLPKRRTSFCSDECSRRYNNITVWNRGRGAYSLRILYRDNFTCQDCGEFHAYKNEYGIYLPIDDGCLEVHHIVFVCDGGGDEPENLITLCKKCHKKRHFSCV